MSNLSDVDWSKIPAPTDDGGASHLADCPLPSTVLTDTAGNQVDVSAVPGLIVIYAYPMTGRPDTPLPDGWDMLPGARGCTPQSCAFRDHADELAQLGVTQIYGLSTQDSDYQREAVERLHLPFQMLSDQHLELTRALRLPTLEVDGRTLLKRLTMIVRDGVIVHTLYPVFPPDQNASVVAQWLRNNRAT